MAQLANAPQLETIANSLLEIASSTATIDASASTLLQEHAACLRQMSMSFKDSGGITNTVDDATETAKKRIFRRSSAILDVIPAVSPTKGKRNSILGTASIGFRDQALMVVEKTGESGGLVDDLEEVRISDVQNKAAIGYWRCCHGVRIYKSRTVTNALRLICSAPVPGLNGINYLDVFNKLTSDADWEHHIYLFGGLVRDILRRKVGNDIDICFTAPAVELDRRCQELGYKCSLDGDYILIGDEAGEEYLEGMVITHNGINEAYHSDFSMNWLFYDFCNDIIVDKTGRAVTAVVENRCEIPCPSHEWIKWVESGGPRVLFRYFKFLIRGYEYAKVEMAYIANHLLRFWANEAERTLECGQDALSSLQSLSVREKKIEYLRQLVFEAYELVASSNAASPPLSSDDSGTLSPPNSPCGSGASTKSGGNTSLPFSSASSWWEGGWVHMLNLTQ